MVLQLHKYFIAFFIVLIISPISGAIGQNLDEDFKKWTTKGRDFIGLNFSVSHQQGTNVERLLTTDQDMYSLDWAVRMYGGHFIKNNITLGALFEWNQSNGDRTFDYDGKTYREDFFSRGFLVGPTLRTYLPLSKSNRFGIFNEVNLLFGYGKGIDQIDDGSEISRALSQSYSLSLGLVPGINFFISDGWAFEASVALLGLETRLQTGTIDGVESRVVTNDVNFRINLLQLKLGVTKYF